MDSNDIPEEVKHMLRTAIEMSQRDAAAMPGLTIMFKDGTPKQQQMLTKVVDARTLCDWAIAELKNQLVLTDGHFSSQVIVMFKDRFVVFSLTLVIGDPEKLGMAFFALKKLVTKENATGIVIVTPSCLHKRPEDISPFLFALLAHAGVRLPGDQVGIHFWSQWRGSPQHKRFVGVKGDETIPGKIVALIEDDAFAKEIEGDKIGYTSDLGNFFEGGEL